MSKDIYDLKLHESLSEEDFRITRVPGGFLYRFWNYTTGYFDDPATFVPISKRMKE